MALVTVTSIEFSDGTQIPIPKSGTVIFVGPNNAGKSQALRDIRGNLESRSYQGVTLTCSYSESDPRTFESWAEQNLPKSRTRGVATFYSPYWGAMQPFELVNQWSQQRGQGLGMFLDICVLHADGSSRLQAGSSQPSFDRSSETPVHPVQLAYTDAALESKLDQACQSAFDLGISVDRWGGSFISLRVGERPDFHHVRGVPTEEYIEALHSLPKLEEQGDGVRSYAGLLLHVMGGTQSVLLVDEPEAFLHPPQAKRLGRVLASHGQDVQAFVSTHSSDVIQGALESSAPVTIVRITREGNVNPAAVLSHAGVLQLWSDPLLRYSNILDGLFHDVVVLCEGDADCRYYSALLDHADEVASPDESRRQPQVLFTHSGGKSRLHSLVRALRSVRVPVVVVADFDILRNEGDLRRIVEELGEDFTSFQADLRVLSAALTSTPKALQRIPLREALNKVLDADSSATVEKREIETLRGYLRSESGWDKAKSGGLSGLPQGDPAKAAVRLLADLERIGILVVPVGELERFAIDVSGHGPSWVSEVLSQNLHQAPGADASDFVTKLQSATRSASGLT